MSGDFETSLKRAEPHVRTIFTIVGAIVLGFVTIAVKDMPAAMARMEVQIQTQSTQIYDLRQQLKEAASDRYTSKDATRDFRIVYDQLGELRSRIVAIESRQQTLIGSGK